MYPLIDIGIIKIQTYFLVQVLVFSGVLFWVVNRSEKFQFNKVFILDLTFILAFFGFIFARLFHVFFENFTYYFYRPIEIFYFWQGGFVFLGGFLGALVAGIAFVKLKKKFELLPALLDFYAPVLALSYALGRVGCFLAGCCYGKYCHLPWAIQERHPTQLYAVLSDGVLFFILYYLEKNKTLLKLGRRGILFAIWLMGHGVGRFILEFYRDDFRGPIYLFSLSGWISLAMIIFSAGYLLTTYNRLSKG